MPYYQKYCAEKEKSVCILELNRIVFCRSHQGNWSVPNEDCFTAQIDGVQTESALQVSKLCHFMVLDY